MEFGIFFFKIEDRDYIIYISRGFGWFLLFEVDCNEVWLDREEFFVNEYWMFCLKISLVWIFLLELKFFSVLEKNIDKFKMKGYVRYKFYNKGNCIICIREVLNIL